MPENEEPKLTRVEIVNIDILAFYLTETRVFVEEEYWNKIGVVDQK